MSKGSDFYLIFTFNPRQSVSLVIDLRKGGNVVCIGFKYIELAWFNWMWFKLISFQVHKINMVQLNVIYIEKRRTD